MSDHSQGQKIGENISAWSLQSLFCSLRIIMCFLKYRFQGHDYGTERCYVWWSCNDQSCITLQIPLSVKKFLIHGISVRMVLSSLCGWFKSQTQNAKWFSVTPLHPAQSWSLTQSQKNGVGMVQYGTIPTADSESWLEAELPLFCVAWDITITSNVPRIGMSLFSLCKTAQTTHIKKTFD